MMPVEAPKSALKINNPLIEPAFPVKIPNTEYPNKPTANNHFFGIQRAANPVSRLKMMLVNAGRDSTICSSRGLASGNALRIWLKSGTIAAFIKMIRSEMDKMAGFCSLDLVTVDK